MARHEDVPPLDEVAAQLERGWDLLGKNDFAGARQAAEAAGAADAEAPEVATLLGAIAAAEGNETEALSCYRKAMELDPTYVAPMLYAAESLLGEEGDLDEALRLTDEALDHAEEEDEYLDALLLRAEVLTTIGGREDEVGEVLAELPPVDFPEAAYHLRAARTFLDIGKLDEAEGHYRKGLTLEPDDAEAYHGLGLVAEEREDPRGMVKAWLKVRELDLEEEAPPWAIAQEEFEAVAEEALAELPDRLRQLLENVPIVAADYPALEIVAEGNDPRMMGFFSGLPYPEKQNVAGGAPHLDCVFLYKRNIERMCRNREEVCDEIRTTLLHETGHFFGLSEEELEEMGLG